jgi:AcrR family transcriptional regulator
VSDEGQQRRRPTGRRAPGRAAPAKGGSGRRRPRAAQGRGGELRQELIEAAGRLLAAAGNEEAVTLRGVAREVGVAAPSIYLHFGDREELLRAVLVDHFAKFGAALKRAVEGGHDPAERLRAGCRAYVEFARDSPGVYAVLFSGILHLDELLGPAGSDGSEGGDGPAGGDGDDTGCARDRRRPPSVASAGARGGGESIGIDTFELLIDGVRTCMDEGDIPRADPLHLALEIWTHLHGGVGLRRAMPRFPWAPADRFVDELLRDLAGLPLDPPRPSS